MVANNKKCHGVYYIRFIIVQLLTYHAIGQNLTSYTPTTQSTSASPHSTITHFNIFNEDDIPTVSSSKQEQQPSVQFPSAVPIINKPSSSDDMGKTTLSPQQQQQQPVSVSSRLRQAEIPSISSVYDSLTSSYNNNNMPSSYWNYNPYSRYGPKYWDDVRVRDSEYMEWIGDDDNDCGDDDQQSPVKIRHERSCRDDHQIHNRRGDPDFDEIEFVIMGHSLRANLEVPRDIDDAARADFSNLTPEYVPIIYAEVKMPSEHYLFGRQFAGEFHMAHFWDHGRGRFVIIAIMMDDAYDEHHPHLEEFIREWEEVAWRRKHNCRRRLDPSIPPYERFYSKRSKRFMEKLWGKSSSSKADWDVYEGFLTTVWYCGYEGSLTVPPCSERVIWRVLDLPMRISLSQSQRMKRLLLNQLDEKCQTSTKAYNGGVNRPLQDNNNDNRVWCCDSGDWKPASRSTWKGKFSITDL